MTWKRKFNDWTAKRNKRAAAESANDMRGKSYLVRMRGWLRLVMRGNVKVIDKARFGVNHAGGSPDRAWGEFLVMPERLNGRWETVFDYDLLRNRWHTKRIRDIVRPLSEYGKAAATYDYIGAFEWRFFGRYWRIGYFTMEVKDEGQN